MPTSEPMSSRALRSMWLRAVLAIGGTALLAMTAACSGAATGPAADSRSYASEDEIMSDSVAVVHMEVIGTAGTGVIDTIDHNLYEARVLASRPADVPHAITVATIPENGLAETIDLSVGSEYVAFLYQQVEGAYLLTSPSEGVFPVTGETVQPSEADTFALDSIARGLGLEGT